MGRGLTVQEDVRDGLNQGVLFALTSKKSGKKALMISNDFR